MIAQAQVHCNSGSDFRTSVADSGLCSTSRTTAPRSTSGPTIASRKDAVKLASPHSVGGYVLTKPNWVLTMGPSLGGLGALAPEPHAGMYRGGQRVCRHRKAGN